MNNDMNNSTNNSFGPQENGNTASGQSNGFYQQNPNTGNSYNFGNPPPIYQGPAQEDKNGSSAQILGIIALVVTFVCCPLVGLILGIIAMNKAKASRLTLGYESQEGKVGRICGLIALIASIVTMVINVAVSVLYIALVVSGIIAGSEFAVLPLLFL